MKVFMIEKPTEENLQELMDLIYPDYFNESFISEGLNYDRASSEDLIRKCIQGISFVAKMDDKILAFCSMVMYKTFYKELLGEVPFFFVHSSCRGSQISRALVTALLDQRDKQGIGKMMITASSINPEHNKMVENLWKKFGFEARNCLTMMKGF